MKRFIAAAFASLLLISGAAFAVPSVQQVERAIQQGDWQTADTELAQVIEAHPNNAHAHYLYGQVLAKEGRYADGLAQIEQAKTLDPQMRFADPQRFAQIEARLRAAANHTAVQPQSTANSFAQTQPATAAAVNPHHGPSMAAWIGMALVFVVIALVLRWTLRRARSNEDGRADEERRAQLKRATELLNAARSLKLDARISSAPGHESLVSEVEGVETQLRELVEALSSGGNPVPAYRIEDLERQLVSLKARAEGRPDPNAAPLAGGPSPSVYAQEAERLQQQQAPYGYPYPPQQQPTVVVQQGGGFGSGVGGLLTGVMLGEALSGGRDRVIERDVYVDDDEERRRQAGNAGNDGNIDFGQGSNDWNDNSGGGVDFGGDDSGGWNDS
jgi:tetratricopeptide (TPR) repeat protein